MGFRPIARIEMGSCSGSGVGSSAAAAFTRIFDIAFKLYIGLAGKRARPCPDERRCDFVASRAIRHTLSTTSLVARAPPDWQKRRYCGPDSSLGLGEKYASICEDYCACHPCISGMGAASRGGWLSGYLGDP